MITVIQKFDTEDNQIEDRRTDITNTNLQTVADYLASPMINGSNDRWFEVDHTFGLEIDGYALQKLYAQMPGVNKVANSTTVFYIGDEARFIVANFVL